MAHICPELIVCMSSDPILHICPEPTVHVSGFHTAYMSPDFTYICPDFIAHVPPELSPVIANWDLAACKSLTPVLSHLPIPCDYKAEPTSPLPPGLITPFSNKYPFLLFSFTHVFPQP